MTTAMGMAAVTAVLRQVIYDATRDINSDIGETISITAVPPDQAIDANGGKPGLNLFLYRVSQNPGWANVELPERDHRGRRVSNPPLALDLHYMLTATGTKDFHCEALLGHGMQALHDYKVLPRAFIDQKLGELDAVNGVSSSMKTLVQSGLSEQIEQVKLTPDFLDRGEISTIWSSIQAKYRPSAFYQASVVLIQRELPVQKPLPVRVVSSPVLTIRRPHIDTVVSESDPDAPIYPGDRVEIEGTSLSADQVGIRLSGDLVADDVSGAADDGILFDLPDDVPVGPHVLQVVHLLELEDPRTETVVGEPRTIFESNSAPFSVRPKVVQVYGSTGVLRIELGSPVHPGQRVFLGLHPKDPNQGEPLAFAVEPPDKAYDVVFAKVGGLRAGVDYVARVQIDGVENLLDFNGSEFEEAVIDTTRGEVFVTGIDVQITGNSARVEVSVEDAAAQGNNVRDATVKLHWSGPTDTQPTKEQATTQANGKAFFTGLDASESGLYAAEVLEVTKSGEVFNRPASQVRVREEKS